MRARALAGSADQVFVLNIPDWGITPFADGRDRPRIAAELDAYNAAIAAECAAQGVRWIDITAIYRAHGAHPDMLANDGLHPSAAMYRRWTEAALPTVLELSTRVAHPTPTP